MSRSRTTRRHRGRSRANRVLLGLERVEERVLLSTFLVTNPDDSGPGTLRQAILDSNANPDPARNAIDFQIGTGGPQSIQLLSALPAVTAPALIDGTSQPGYDPTSGLPLIEVNGAGAGPGADGLTVAAGHSVVEGLTIDGFSGAGIHVINAPHIAIGFNTIGSNGGDGIFIEGASSSGSLLQSNDIGTDGLHPLPNQGNGIEVAGAPANTISGNTIAANAKDGVLISGPGASGNVIDGVNTIGASDVAGLIATGNSGNGVEIIDAPGNTVGDATGFNLIGANGGDGILIEGAGAAGNTLASNFVGLGIDTGSPVALPNKVSGIAIDGAPGTVIGSVSGLPNFIGDNAVDGVFILGAGASGTVIEGTYIGASVVLTAGAADVAVPNKGFGIGIDGAPGTTVGGTTDGARNIISGNVVDGVFVSGAGATGTVIEGNYIGVDDTGTTALGNEVGVGISGVVGVEVGGTDPTRKNVISGNQIGVSLSGQGTSGNRIQGNDIGTDPQGTTRISNVFGVVLDKGATANTIGGTSPGAGNLISGNSGDGISLTNGAGSNLIQANLIGCDVTGTKALPNILDGIVAETNGNQIGGTDPAARNVIATNGANGINLLTGSNNVIEGNSIGTDVTGLSPLPNLNDGILVESGASNTIGGGAPGAGNLIDDSGVNGIDITNPGSKANVVQGNRVGVDQSGTVQLSNIAYGIVVEAGALDTTIGGTGAGEGNVISANGRSGVLVDGAGPGTVILGDIIGSDASGTKDEPNIGHGIELRGVDGATIGGTSPGSRNLISSNSEDGIRLQTCTAVVIQGNLIGVDASGVVILPNLGNGIRASTSSGLTIGGTAPAARNVITGNQRDGVFLDTQDTNNVVLGNFIGIGADGNPLLNVIGNPGNGVEIFNNSSRNTIGGTDAGARNIISANGLDGVLISVSSDANLVEGNFIGTNPFGTRDRAVGNGNQGVEITLESANNTIGGTAAGAGNVLSNNHGDGILISFNDPTVPANLVEGNEIGTDPSGTVGVGNNQYGVVLLSAQGNVVGGTAPGAGNLISGNLLAGILIQGNNARANVIQGNRIGTAQGGTSALANQQGGVILGLNAAGNTIGGASAGAANVISGNQANGVELIGSDLPGGIASSATVGNLIQGNFIGVDASGTKPLGNARDGILLSNAAQNVIGGMAPQARNILSANGASGVEVDGANAVANAIQNNLVGTDVTGTVALGNRADGIAIDGAPATLIGGDAPGAGNVVSGNGADGILVANETASPIAGQLLAPFAVIVAGNTIGTNSAGGAALGNGGNGVTLDESSHVLVGGLEPGGRNLISGNGVSGVEIAGVGASANDVLANFIGVDRSGRSALPNLVGMFVNGAPGNVIGGTTADVGRALGIPLSPAGGDLGNVISGNANVGIQILNSGAARNLVQANEIGTDPSAEVAIGNAVGVFIYGVSVNVNQVAVSGNLVGGPAAGEGNVISGNPTGVYIFGAQAPGNAVQGNRIGTNREGTRLLANGSGGAALGQQGILISDSPGDLVGGPTPSAGNLIAGFQVGVELADPPATGDVLLNNLVGTDASGNARLGNLIGVFINAAPGNRVGAAGAGNIISGNDTGVYLLGTAASGNTVQGNLIGLGANGTTAVGNHTGVFISGARNNLIGGSSSQDGNVISGNVTQGSEGSTAVYLFNNASGNTVIGNFIGTDKNGNSGTNLGNGDYGILEYNAPSNNVPQKGPSSNRFSGSGIANFREFTGSTGGSSSSSGGSGRHVTRRPAGGHPSGPRTLPRSRTGH